MTQKEVSVILNEMNSYTRDMGSDRANQVFYQYELYEAINRIKTEVYNITNERGEVDTLEFIKICEEKMKNQNLLTKETFDEDENILGYEYIKHILRDLKLNQIGL